VILELYFGKQPFDIYEVLRGVIMSPLYQIAILALVVVNGRTVLFRMDDKEAQRQQ